MRVVFRGGLEDYMLSETLQLDIEKLSKPTVGDLILFIEQHHIKNAYRHFSSNGELEGGILCLVNECDWDLLDRENATLTNSDTIHFITTMHGG
ncbi:ubiquitin related modifier 1 [Nematocida homosporus]|uniref:ubiquitin related modifier 1 n=1 Tax=Nematocida homosporus TaxID=1912981 RepID=UPI00221EAB8F|nr:ubiquitin related modifier 1 [Nematocida homosporus]KAI5185766.1 ubiquitin related modifier 1 [Nematocida homosporus]